MTDAAKKRVYYARAMDGLSESKIMDDSAKIGRKLRDAGIQMLDPYTSLENRPELDPAKYETSKRIVEEDLTLLRTADAVLMDLSIEGRSYVGCIGELIYSYSFGIPVVVNVGATDLHVRHWLRYHATTVVSRTDSAIDAIVSLLSPGMSQSGC